MEYLLGLFSGIVLFVVIGVVYFIGYKQGNKRPQVKADEEEKRQAMQHLKEFQQLMRYDINTALQRKKV